MVALLDILALAFIPLQWWIASGSDASLLSDIFLRARRVQMVTWARIEKTHDELG